MLGKTNCADAKKGQFCMDVTTRLKKKKMVMSFLLSFKELKGFAQTVLCSRSNKCCTNVYIAVDHYYALLEKGKAT